MSVKQIMEDIGEGRHVCVVDKYKKYLEDQIALIEPLAMTYTYAMGIHDALKNALEFLETN